MPAHASPLNALRSGLQGMAAQAAVRSIEGWEAKLAGVEVPGVETLLQDLAALKQQLRSGELDGEAVRTLVAALGRQTAAIAGRMDGKDAGRIKEIGKALSAGAKRGGAGSAKA